MNEQPEGTPEMLSYYVLPDDPLRALNILREAAGLSPLPEEEKGAQEIDG